MYRVVHETRTLVFIFVITFCQRFEFKFCFFIVKRMKEFQTSYFFFECMKEERECVRLHEILV